VIADKMFKKVKNETGCNFIKFYFENSTNNFNIQ